MYVCMHVWMYMESQRERDGETEAERGCVCVCVRAQFCVRVKGRWRRKDGKKVRTVRDIERQISLTLIWIGLF